MAITTKINGLLCRITSHGGGIWAVECNGRTAFIAMHENGLASEFHAKIVAEFQ